MTKHKPGLLTMQKSIVKKVKCQSCENVFNMPDTFIGVIRCEECDPFMNPIPDSMIGRVYNILYDKSVLSDGDVGVRIIHEDEWPIREIIEAVRRS